MFPFARYTSSLSGPGALQDAGFVANYSSPSWLYDEMIVNSRSWHDWTRPMLDPAPGRGRNRLIWDDLDVQRHSRYYQIGWGDALQHVRSQFASHCRQTTVVTTTHLSDQSWYLDSFTRFRPYLAHFSPLFPVFCAFSPSRRDGSNDPQAGTQDHSFE